MSATLRSLEGGGWFEPGSRILSLGYDEHSPQQVLEVLAEDDLATSVALHELAHFHSLDNLPGSALTLMGLLTGLLGDSVKEILEDPTKHAPGPNMYTTLAYLRWRSRYLEMLNTWRPLLEGLAIASQVVPTCEDHPDLTLPRWDLWYFESVVKALSDETESAQARWLMPAATKRAILNGPLLGAGDTSLAVDLEFSESQSELSYFLGAAYVRALQDRLSRKAAEFACPETSLNWLFRAIRSAGVQLLGKETRWESPDAINRLYSWIELVEQAPGSRVRGSLDLEWDIDRMEFLKSGRLTRGVRGGAEDFVTDLANCLPAAWQDLSDLGRLVDYDQIARELGDPPLPDSSIGEDVMAKGWLAGTQTLCLSSGGSAQPVGWVPGGVNGRHAVALRIGGATWWLLLEDSEVSMAPFNVDQLPCLARESVMRSSADLAAGPDADALVVSCFFTRAGYGLPQLPAVDAHIRAPRFLVEFRSTSIPDRLLLATVVPGKTRAHLTPVPKETTLELHLALEGMRTDVDASLGASYEQLADLAARRGLEDISARIKEARLGEQLASSRQLQLWVRRILRGLVGAAVSPDMLRSISAKRMSALVPDGVFVRQLASRAYASSYNIRDLKHPEAIEYIQGLNRSSLDSIGKRLFDIDVETGDFEYLGLWRR
jgi:hypothetical protein